MDKFILYSILKVYRFNTVESNGRIINSSLFDVNVSCHTYFSSTSPLFSHDLL